METYLEAAVVCKGERLFFFFMTVEQQSALFQ